MVLGGDEPREARVLDVVVGEQDGDVARDLDLAALALGRQRERDRAGRAVCGLDAHDQTEGLATAQSSREGLLGSTSIVGMEYVEERPLPQVPRGREHRVRVGRGDLGRGADRDGLDVLGAKHRAEPAATGVPAPLQIMQSRGGISAAANAAQRPVRLFLSGPAAGVVGGVAVGKTAGVENLITVDIGGTSCDIALVSNGEPLVRAEGVIDGYTVRVPMVDVTAIGSGGGSIALLDDAGALRVGPQSAGSEPGPACYGRGGTADSALGRGWRMADSQQNLAHLFIACIVRRLSQEGGKLETGVLRALQLHEHTTTQ